MKKLGDYLSLIFIAIFLIAIIIIGCDKKAKSNNNDKNRFEIYDNHFGTLVVIVVIIDDCEYLVDNSGEMICHKGNCKNHK